MSKTVHPFLMAMQSLSWLHENSARREKFKSLTEHINDNHLRRVTEVLCEQQLIRMDSLQESAASLADVALFQKYALKVIPRVYPSLFVKDLISIQPMPLPTGKVFYKDFLRETNDTRLDAKASFSRTFANRGTAPTVGTPGSPPSTTGEYTNPKKIRMTLTSAEIVATSKALQYEFSAELNQDLQAYHGISADPELGAAAAQEIQREIEYDIIQTLLDSASAGNVNWSAVPPVADGQKSIDTEAYNKTLFNAIVDGRNLVYKKRFTYPNWMICHPDFAVRLEKLSGFEYDKSVTPDTITQGRKFFGTLRNVIKVFVDPWFPDTNKAVLGYKGTEDFDVGLVYSPYIPFYSTEPFTDPNTLSTRRALLSRQAISLLVSDMYSTVTITNAS